METFNIHNAGGTWVGGSSMEDPKEAWIWWYEITKLKSIDQSKVESKSNADGTTQISYGDEDYLIIPTPQD